jgi:hypothetical protein
LTLSFIYVSIWLLAVAASHHGRTIAADNQPVTVVVDTVRALVLGAPAGDLLVRSMLWVLGLLAVFGPLTIRPYRRTTT